MMCHTLKFGASGTYCVFRVSGPGIFLFTTASRMILGPTQPPIQWIPGALSLEVKQPRHEADHSPPPSAKAKECVELYLHSPSTSSWHGA